jgi:hypothetical protein
MSNDPVKLARAAWESGFAIVAKALNEVLADHKTGLKIDAPKPARGETFDAARRKLVDEALPYLYPGPPGGTDRLWRVGSCLWIRGKDAPTWTLATYVGLLRWHDQGAAWFAENVVEPVTTHAAEMRKWFDALEAQGAEGGGWSKAATPTEWGRAFGISGKAFTRRVRDGTIVARPLDSNRLFQVRVDCLPRPR